MTEKTDVKFRIHCNPINYGWSIGIAITHDSILHETYLYFNVFKWSIQIGFMAD